VLAFVAIVSPPGRGALLALASAAKFAPLALAPLFAGFARFRLRDAVVFASVFAAVLALVFVPFLPDGGFSELWDRTLGYQLNRDSPFSIWGQEDWLGPVHIAVTAAAGLLALAVAFVPREKNVLQALALGSAVLLAVQITMSHWFYLYVVWWFPLAFTALLARGPGSAR